MVLRVENLKGRSHKDCGLLSKSVKRPQLDSNSQSMALINTQSMLIYVEIDEADPPPVPTAHFLVGIFDAPDAEHIAKYEEDKKIWESKGAFVRLLTRTPTMKADSPRAVCKAAAYIADDGKILIVKNVGAEQGYGPTLFAVLMELARARGRKGVAAPNEPGSILEKPKLILQRFCHGAEYEGKVQTTPASGKHTEEWLNMLYSLEPKATLLDYNCKRAKWKAYEAFWQNWGGSGYWRVDAFDMAQRSVDAHASRC